ncbi:MAG: thermonuclease family protein [Mycobacteriales bacterium]
MGAVGWISSPEKSDDDTDSAASSARTEVQPSLEEPGDLLGEGEVVGVNAADSAQVRLDGAIREAQVIGIDAPSLADKQCWASESTAFAERTLSGRIVKVFTAKGYTPPEGSAPIEAYIVLPDQRNYSVAALEAGAARTNADVSATPFVEQFQAAQRKAEDGKTGMWGEPCQGSVQATPPPSASPQSAPPAPQAAPQPAPEPAPKPAPRPKPKPAAPDSGGSAYYKNCDAARAAGAAPVRRGEPGYGKHLDRDGNGVGCE